MKYIDLFSGCGGLSLGLNAAGFKLELAVEKSPMAAETFYHNFIKKLTSIEEWNSYCELPIEKQSDTGLIVNDIQSVLTRENFLSSLRKKDIDLLVGGPPCQGFSTAGRRDPDDARNQLPWQLLDFVAAIQPKAVLIENVVGIRKMYSRHGVQGPIEELISELRQIHPGYAVQPLELNAMHFGVPQHRPRVMLVALRRDIAARLGIVPILRFWQSALEERNQPVLAPQVTQPHSRCVKDALWDIGDKGYTTPADHKKYSTPEGEYAASMRNPPLSLGHLPLYDTDTRKLKNHKLRCHDEKTKKRFRLIQYLEANKIPSKLISQATGGEIDREEIRDFLANARYPAKAPDREFLAENERQLVRLIVAMATKKHSQRPLKWRHPSPTVLSLPDDFVHPTKARTLTVREMARFQSFPDYFEFRSKETTGGLRRRVDVPQYTQVGNAVPPLLGYAIGERLQKLLREAESAFSPSAIKAS